MNQKEKAFICFNSFFFFGRWGLFLFRWQWGDSFSQVWHFCKVCFEMQTQPGIYKQWQNEISPSKDFCKSRECKLNIFCCFSSSPNYLPMLKKRTFEKRKKKKRSKFPVVHFNYSLIIYLSKQREEHIYMLDHTNTAISQSQD